MRAHTDKSGRGQVSYDWKFQKFHSDGNSQGCGAASCEQRVQSSLWKNKRNERFWVGIITTKIENAD